MLWHVQSLTQERRAYSYEIPACIHTYTLADEGRVYSCGWGEFGQLGHGDNSARSEPSLIEAFAIGAKNGGKKTNFRTTNLDSSTNTDDDGGENNDVILDHNDVVIQEIVCGSRQTGMISGAQLDCILCVRVCLCVSSGMAYPSVQMRILFSCVDFPSFTTLGMRQFARPYLHHTICLGQMLINTRRQTKIPTFNHFNRSIGYILVVFLGMSLCQATG